MRAVVQRVSRARVSVQGNVVGEIERGYLVLLGVGADDTSATARKVAEKVTRLRLFEDEAGKMNLGLGDVDGAVLCVSQFTLYGDVRRGNRPSFDRAAKADASRPIYEEFCSAIEGAAIPCVRGAFGEHMMVELVNDGPVTLIVDSRHLEGPRRA